jgi:HEPN domain-containing protein
LVEKGLLLYLLSKSVPEMEKPITEFVKKNKEKLRALDDAYITSICLPSLQTHEDAEMLVRLAEDLIQFMNKVLKECR